MHPQLEYYVGNPPKPSGLCLLKVLVRESYLDSNATSGMIRTQLSELDSYMAEVGNDIVKFNTHVKTLIKALSSRGERTLDLLTYLFKAYLSCTDEKFVKYISDIQSKHDDGDEMITATSLMNKAMNRYKILQTRGEWEARSRLEERIIAMQARLDAKSNKGKRSSDGNKGSQGGDKKKAKRDNDGKSKSKPKWLADNVKPAPADINKTKTWIGDKPWYWCGAETGDKCERCHQLAADKSKRV